MNYFIFSPLTKLNFNLKLMTLQFQQNMHELMKCNKIFDGVYLC